ncbi:hypothetical protein GCM10010252_49300 [Streptomyces aureoverticillatus]|nr:hypothetical protein GCM10010252_49300 [Streptomyces aureoverticillatus]
MTRTRTRTRSRSAGLAAAAAALALLATACSGGDGGGDGGGKKDTGSKENAADKAFKERECLRKHGLKVAEPKSGEDDTTGITIGGDLSKEKMQKALKECTGNGPGSAGGGISQADKDKMLKYAQCMRKNGYNMPDPKFEDGMARAMPAPKGAEMKKMEKAAKACKGIVG